MLENNGRSDGRLTKPPARRRVARPHRVDPFVADRPLSAEYEPPKARTRHPKRPVTPGYITAWNGKKFKSLKRHLAVRYGLAPNEYRARWD
ncbi:MucR family transcriptional regulator [Mesorhizobium sp. RCC_202]|uniref:MucR family transcriptional regulator n=1 Tax=Mesorhizobium sp. RCC_202 TaxID=3239222 RepID=UPI0035243966